MKTRFYKAVLERGSADGVAVDAPGPVAPLLIHPVDAPGPQALGFVQEESDESEPDSGDQPEPDDDGDDDAVP